jgi:hypothetical protein
MKKRKMTADPDVIALDKDIKVAALLAAAAIVTDKDEASVFLTALAESLINSLPKPLQSGAGKLVQKDALIALKALGYGDEKPRKRRAKA